MNTDWPSYPNFGFGIFGGGKLGVDLQQALISLAFAKQLGPVAVGVAPILARQQFKARGLGAFGIPPTDTDVSWGGGVRGGVELSLSPSLRIGVAATSRTWMQDFDKYSGLFAEQGGFDSTHLAGRDRLQSRPEPDAARRLQAHLVRLG